MKKHIISVMLIAGTVALCGCSANNGASSAEKSSQTSEVTASMAETAEAPAESSVLADLTGTYDDVSEKFEFSDGWSNGSMFNCTWRKDNGSIFDGSMKLTIDKDLLDKPPYSGAEFRSRDFYGYGMYEVVMKPIKNDGVVSSFFTYTGPSDNNPWDEIDIEFLGKDTTKVQFNYFTDSKGNHEFLYDLGFDASEEFHTYGFDGKIMMNVWPGTGVDGWLNAFDGTVPLTAEYKSVDFTAAEEG